MCWVTTLAATRYPKCHQIGEKCHGPRKSAGVPGGPVRRDIVVLIYLRGAPMGGGETMVSVEGAAERLFRVVPDMPGDGNDAHRGIGQELLGQVHAPLGEVPDGRAAKNLTETLVE
jgi:hypothetical protein